MIKISSKDKKYSLHSQSFHVFILTLFPFVRMTNLSHSKKFKSFLAIQLGDTGQTSCVYFLFEGSLIFLWYFLEITNTMIIIQFIFWLIVGLDLSPYMLYCTTTCWLHSFLSYGTTLGVQSEDLPVDNTIGTKSWLEKKIIICTVS